MLSPTKLKIFIVFHKVFDERLSLPFFSQSEIHQWFIKYAVNIKHLDKKIIDQNGNQTRPSKTSSDVVLEYQLPIHDPHLQERGFMETSCFVHIEQNHLYGDAQYVGVCQYDMRWTKGSTKIVRRLDRALSEPLKPDSWLTQLKMKLGLAIDPKKTVFAQIAGPFKNTDQSFNPMAATISFDWTFLLRSYNQFFNTNYDLGILDRASLTLWQTYLMPTSIFSELASWLIVLCEEVYPWANESPYETHWGVLGGFTERAESLFMAIRELEERIKLRHLYLEHDQSIPAQLGISKTHYGQ
jgi:hypothetical protein